MEPEQFVKMQQSIEATIERVVNGKINRLSDKVDQYIKEDNEWKLNVGPSIEVMKKMQGFATTGGWILKSVMMIGGAVSVVWALIKFLSKK